MSAHPIVHIELAAQDREQAGQFYHQLFGWEIQHYPEMNYTTFSSGEGSVGGGFNPLQEDNPPGTVLVYVHTDDIEATLAQVESLGGQILQPKSEIQGVGWFARFKDPTGNIVALLTSLEG